MLETTLEALAVIVIALSVLALVARSFYLTLMGKKQGLCCRCDTCTMFNQDSNRCLQQKKMTKELWQINQLQRREKW